MLTFGGLWLVAAVVAGVIAWQGVGVVSDQVTDQRPAALAAADIEAKLAEAATTTTTVPGAPTTPLPSPTTSAPDLTPPATATATTRASESPPTTVPASAPPTTTAAPAGETRTYSLVGGTASLRFSPAGVEVVFANPAPGFRVEIEPEHGNGVKVEFESETHESRVDGWWDGGPQDRVQEEAAD